MKAALVLVAALALAGCAWPGPEPGRSAAGCGPGDGASLVLRVLDPGGRPAAGVEVSVVSAESHRTFQPDVARDRTDAGGCARLPLTGGPGHYLVAAGATECLQGRSSFEWTGSGDVLHVLPRACPPAAGPCAAHAALDRSTLLVHVQGAGAGVPVTVGHTPGSPPPMQAVETGRPGEVLRGDEAGQPDPSASSQAVATDAAGCVALPFQGVGTYRIAVPFASCTRVDWLLWGGHTHLAWVSGRPVGNGEGPEPCPA